MSSNSSVKSSPANVIKASAAILNLVSFSLFDQRDSDKPEKIKKIYRFFLAVAYEHCVTINYQVIQYRYNVNRFQ